MPSESGNLKLRLPSRQLSREHSTAGEGIRQRRVWHAEPAIQTNQATRIQTAAK
jgi:hypothetical protein